jgi:hypothetical protein
MVHTSQLASRKPPTSCLTCFAWGLLPGRYCSACYSFAQNHATGVCAGCGRTVALKKGYCRLCWCQASLEAQNQVTVLAPYLQRIRHHQLFFAWMHKPRQPGPRLGKQGRYIRKSRYQLPPLVIPATGVDQLSLFDLPRDFTRFDRRLHANLGNPWLNCARHTLIDLGERRGWPKRVLQETDRALIILLSGHVQGDKVRYSDLFPALRARGLTVERTVEVLDQLGLFDNDRVPTFER